MNEGMIPRFLKYQVVKSCNSLWVCVFSSLLNFCVSDLTMRHRRYCKLSPVRPHLLSGITEAERGVLLTGFESQSFLNLLSPPDTAISMFILYRPAPCHTDELMTGGTSICEINM